MRFAGLAIGFYASFVIGSAEWPNAPFTVALAIVAAASFVGYVFGSLAEDRR